MAAPAMPDFSQLSAQQSDALFNYTDPFSSGASPVPVYQSDPFSGGTDWGSVIQGLGSDIIAGIGASKGKTVSLGNSALGQSSVGIGTNAPPVGGTNAVGGGVGLSPNSLLVPLVIGGIIVIAAVVVLHH